MTSKKPEPLTSYIKHLAVSGLLNVSARIKSSYKLIGKSFEMPNVSYTQPLYASVKPIRYINTIKKIEIITKNGLIGLVLR